MLHKNVNIHEAKTHLSRLLQFASDGNEVTICKAGVPIAKLVSTKTSETGKRQAGTLKGKIKISADFDSMPEWFNDHFK